MEITEVRIKLMEDTDDRLQAFCSVTFDDAFVVRDLKIIEGSSGPFVAMPSRKLTAHCPQCGCKNHLRASYCNQCGQRLNQDRALRDAEGRAKLYADIAHPINSLCREMIQTRVIAEFRTELNRSQQPGYISRYDEDYEDAGPEELHEGAPPPPPQRVSQRVDDHAHGRPAPHSQLPAPPREQQGGPHRPPSQSRSAPPVAAPQREPEAPPPPPQKPDKGNFGQGIF
ncbi:MAG TPA: septation protein SpoVG family protein [Pirellulaceae bacterium]|nr:septation protein SpoVG family protein [Pirellulaceae bacterium]